MKPLHFRCDCGANGNGTGPGAEDAIRFIIAEHVLKLHTVKSWRRGSRDRATTHVSEAITGTSSS